MTMLDANADTRLQGADGPLGPGVRRVHMIGIGGAGMEGLARLLAGLGYRVTGSDAAAGPVLADLRQAGIAVFHGHDADHVRGADLVVHSAAVRPDNVERQAAARAGIPQSKRAAVLGRLSRSHDTVAVAGTHGKTTTASLIAAALRAAGRQPTVAVGGWVGGRTQAVTGADPILVAEADEYDRSFHELHPWVAVVTNIEAEHMDCYRDEADLVDAFAAFVERTRPAGRVIVNGDDPRCAQAVARLSEAGLPAVTTFGFGAGCDVRADAVRVDAGGVAFDCRDAGGTRGVRLRLPGRHNVANALAAWAAAGAFGLEEGAVLEALEAFAGVDRRFQWRGDVGGVRIIDDYAHHPTEVAATLAAARGLLPAGAQLVAVLQPHTYSRTQRFADGFAAALSGADRAWVTSVYASREVPADGAESDVIVAAMLAGGTAAVWEADVDRALRAAWASCAAGDWLVVMGAGDIGRRLDALLQAGGG